MSVTSPTRGSLKQHPGRGTQAGTQSLVHGRGSPNLLCSPVFQGFAQANSFPQQGRNLKHVRRSASKSITGLCYLNTDVPLVQHTRPNNNSYNVCVFQHPSCKSLGRVYNPSRQSSIIFPQYLMTDSDWSMQTAEDDGRPTTILHRYTILYLGPVLQHLQKLSDLGPVPQD